MAGAMNREKKFPCTKKIGHYEFGLLKLKKYARPW